jgi:hypothetical protein
VRKKPRIGEVSGARTGPLGSPSPAAFIALEEFLRNYLDLGRSRSSVGSFVELHLMSSLGEQPPDNAR